MDPTDFDQIHYLQTGNLRQQRVFYILSREEAMDKLKAFDPLLTGTIPINIDTSESDLDIICYWKDKETFKTKVISEFSGCADFKIAEKVIGDFLTVVATFVIDNFKIEIFGQNRPTKSQEAYRHMLIEDQILRVKGEDFRQEIIKQKRDGVKTEQAFANLLGIAGDPYQALLMYKLEK